MPKLVIEKHPLAIRWLHWIHFPLLTVMLWSGLLIYWANSVYQIRIGGKVLFHFFPKRFYDALGVPFHLADGMALHFTFMWLFFLNGMVYVLYLWWSGSYRHLLPGKNALQRSWQVVLHDLHLRRQPPPQEKYNAAQQIAYTSVIAMGFLMILTGLAIYKPVQLHWLTALCGGYDMARAEHFTISVLFVLFFLVHVLQVIRAGWGNFSSMITGFVTVKTKPRPPNTAGKPPDKTAA